MIRKTSYAIPQIVTVLLVIIHIIYVFFPLWTFSRHCIFHVTAMLTIALLYRLKETHINYHRVIMGFLLSLTLISGLYVAIEANRLEIIFGMGLTTLDFVVGCIILGIVLIVTYVLWGWVIPVLTLVSILYMFFGPDLSGVFHFPAMSHNVTMAFLGMGISAGVFGYLIPVSASLVFYFMVFGGILEACGMLPLFLEVGNWVGGKLRGGAAYTAIVGSSLLGTVVGATTANIALTGQYTIPTMKTQGFKGPSAVAVESVSSMGGQILPPVMGAGAFVMATLTNTPYINICRMALLPALLYYVSITVAITILIHSSNIKIIQKPVNKRLILERLPVFIVPITIIVVMFVMRYSPSRVITLALFSSIAVSLARKCTRPSFRSLLDGFAKGGRLGAEIAIAIMAIAIIAQASITTTLAPKIGYAITQLSGGIIPLSLLMLMITCLILGVGMPTVAAYTIVAIVVVPSLVGLGISIFSAHFFAFYFAVFAAVTPPVATAAIVGSKIAGSDFWRCAAHGIKLAIPLFAIPFAFANQPQLLAFPFIGISGLMMVIVVLSFTWAFSMCLYRYFLVRVDNVELALCLLATGMSLIYIVLTPNSLLIMGTVVSLAVLTFRQLFRRSRSVAI